MCAQRTRLGVTIVSFVALWAGEASARPGSMERYPIGAETAGMGGAGIASTGSAWFNPAGLGAVTEEGLSASVSAYGYTMEQAPDFIDVDLGGGDRISGKISNGAVDLFPASLQYVKPLESLGPLQHGLGLSVVVPDFDQFDGVLEVPARELLFEIKARRLAESQTFWAVAGWGGCVSQVCFGLAPAAAIHMQQEVNITTFFTEFETGETADATDTTQLEILTAGLGAQAGILFRPMDGLSIGATVRSPLIGVHGSGSSLTVASVIDSVSGTAYVDRVEVQKPQLSYRQPWRIGLGFRFEEPKAYAIAVDARFTTGISEYALIAGPNGEETLPPKFPGGQIDDPERAISVMERVGLRPILNFNVGGRVHVSESLVIQAGSFSDLSATSDDDVLENFNDQMNRLGATLGAAWLGEDVSTWVTAIYAYGWGAAAGIGDNFETVLTDTKSHAILLFLGSTAEL